MSAPKRARNPRGDGAKLRDEIVLAAVELIDANDSPATLSLRGIARQAGISAPSIYGHFPDLESVIEAVLVLSFDQLGDAVAAAIGSHEADASAALLAAGRTYVEFGWAHRARYRMMFDASGYAHNAARTYRMVEALIARCAASGESDSSDPHLDAWMLWAGLHGVATLEKPNRNELQRLGPIDRVAMLDTIIRRLARVGDYPAQSSGPAG
jgi:AcrR family transcriptional regulator